MAIHYSAAVFRVRCSRLCVALFRHCSALRQHDDSEKAAQHVPTRPGGAAEVAENGLSNISQWKCIILTLGGVIVLVGNI